jgi:hypothetical protein
VPRAGAASMWTVLDWAAARQLVAMLGMLSRRSHRRGKLGVVKSMTADG